MRLVRTLAAAAAIVAALAAWPQEPAIPPTVDHSQHQVIDAPSGRPVPSLIVHLFPDSMDGYNLFLETQNYRFTPENVDDVIVANEGHAHLYVNGEKIARLYSQWRHLPRAVFEDGVNRLQVELNANDHSIWGVAGEPIGADVLVDTEREGDDPIVRERVRYTLDWDWGEAQPHSSGGWTTVNDLGFLVHVEGGKVVTRGLELLPCHTMPMASPTALLNRWLAPVTAYAGHGSLLPNESKITRSYEEDLAKPEALFLESRVVTDPAYCQAHYLIARPRGTGPGASAFEVWGNWSRAEDGPCTAFRVEYSAAYGEIQDLLDAASGAPAQRSIVGGVEITVVRSLHAMFDGIDLSETPPEKLGSQILKSLVSGSKIMAGPYRKTNPRG